MRRLFLFLFFLAPLSALPALDTDGIGLEESIALSAERNNGLIIDMLQRQDAWRSLRLRLRDFLPDLELGYTQNDSITVGRPDSRLRTLSLGLTQTVFNGGRNLASYRSAERDMQLQDLKGTDLRFSVAHSVILQFAAVLKHKQILELKNRSLINLEEQVRIAELEMELGLLKENDFLDLQIQTSEFALGIRESEEQLLQSRFELSRLLSLPLEQLPPLMGKLNPAYEGQYAKEIGTSDDFRKRFSALAEEYNKDLLALKLQERNDRYKLRESRLSWIPKVDFTGDLSVSGSQFPLDEPSFSIGLDLTFDTPLLPGNIAVQAGKSDPDEHNAGISSSVKPGDNVQGITAPRSASTAYRITAMRREELLRSLRFQVRSACESIHRQQRSLELIKEKINLQEQRLSIEEKKLELGEITRLEYMESELDLTESRIALLENVTALFNSEKELDILCGVSSAGQGGFFLPGDEGL